MKLLKDLYFNFCKYIHTGTGKNRIRCLNGTGSDSSFKARAVLLPQIYENKIYSWIGQSSKSAA